MKWLRALCYVVVFIVVLVLSTAGTIRFFLQDVSTVSCPDVMGLDYEDAKRVADQAGLSAVAIKYEVKKDIPYNRVLAQKPEAAVPVRAGRTISVILADGPKPTTIPQLVGLSVEEAQGELVARGMPVKKILYVPNEMIGRVLAQTPGSGEGIAGDGVVLVAGGTEKRFYVMPEISASDGIALIQELESKGIKHSIASAEAGREQTPRAKRTAKTIFGEDVVIELPAGINEGGN
jgi:eukaryotic-like serine/threonine-protein kinase